VRDRLLCQGISVIPSGRLPSLRKRPEGSFVTGILVEANTREMMSLRVWFLVIRLGAILHMKTLRPHVSTCDPHRQVCAAQRPRPSRKTTTTRTASSSRRPHEAIGSANSQSPLCLAAAAKKASFCHGSLFCCFRLSHGQPGGPACPMQIVYETSCLLEQDRKWSASGLCMIGKRNQPERSGWVGLRPGVIGCLQLKLQKQKEQAKQPVSLQGHPP